MGCKNCSGSNFSEKKTLTSEDRIKVLESKVFSLEEEIISLREYIQYLDKDSLIITDDDIIDRS